MSGGTKELQVRGGRPALALSVNSPMNYGSDLGDLSVRGTIDTYGIQRSS